MKRYLQACYKNLIDLDTWKMIGQAERAVPYEIQVPFYLWTYPELSGHKYADGMCLRTHTIELNDLSVKFRGHYMQAVVTFIDTAEGCVREIKINTDIETVRHATLTGHIERTYGVDYVIDGITGVSNIRTDFHGIAFSQMPGLGVIDIPKYANADFSYGIYNLPYTIYRGDSQLRTNRYVLLCGSWAVVLHDDFTFCALVLLEAAMPRKLYLHKVLYSTDRTFIKELMLAR